MIKFSEFKKSMDEADDKTSSPQDPDIKDRKGSQPATFHKGIKSKSTKAARDRVFAKQSKMDDDDPKAYKPAPGDATHKTSPSQYTLKYKKMFGEASASDNAKAKISQEKDADKRKHDRIMDAARLRDVRKKNRVTK